MKWMNEWERGREMRKKEKQQPIVEMKEIINCNICIVTS